MVPDLKQCHGTEDLCIQGSGPFTGTGHRLGGVPGGGRDPGLQVLYRDTGEQGHCDTVEPDLEVSEKYHGIYQKYKNIYPLVREFYSR